ncbi:gluconokinase [Agromyces bracchium]|uniref:Gluconokinase n=1 Tax=Agromyces bracchium TaxID=88376 RepID=A0A6I3MA39_9MICO|nr:gluconokinase [Agromyces bracchium]MTH70174.1 AAA family ATPase [Agromyces bracchium]
MVSAAVGPVVVMGVSASGKSTIGHALADRLGVPFIDGDDLHPQENVAKMRSGVPLVDDDRWPWLDVVGAALAEGAATDAGGVVIACSALRRAYRERILATAPATRFVHLDLTESALADRAGARVGHFMPPALLASQLATLEGLGSDEPGFALDAAAPVPEIVDAAVARLGA